MARVLKNRAAQSHLSIRTAAGVLPDAGSSSDPFRGMTKNILVAASLVLAAVACGDPEVRKARLAAESRTRVEAAATVASRAAAAPSIGRWDAAHLVKRLVDAGLAPQRRESVQAQSWMGAPVIGYQLGVATVDAYVYADSVERRAAVAGLDSATFAPKRQPAPWGTPFEVVTNNNLVAVVVGGTDRQRERIVSALAAGLGAP